MVEMSTRHISAYVNHNNGTKVVEASTKEFCITRHLYKSRDVSAAFNIGCAIAFRCKEAGLSRVMWQYSKDRKNDRVSVQLCICRVNNDITHLGQCSQATTLCNSSLSLFFVFLFLSLCHSSQTCRHPYLRSFL